VLDAPTNPTRGDRQMKYLIDFIVVIALLGGIFVILDFHYALTTYCNGPYSIEGGTLECEGEGK